MERKRRTIKPRSSLKSEPVTAYVTRAFAMAVDDAARQKGLSRPEFVRWALRCVMAGGDE